MNPRDMGIMLTAFVCCIWPVTFHLFIVYGIPWIRSKDWRQIQFKNPWSKNE